MAMKKSSTARKSGRGAPNATPEETQKLHEFFRGLYQDRDRADRYNKSRAELVDSSDLSDAHKDLIKSGCIPDVIHALVGAPSITADYMISVECQDSICCNHAHCRAFARAAKANAPKKAARKKPAAAKGKKKR